MYVGKSTRVGKVYRPRKETKRGYWQVMRKDGSGQKDTWGMTGRVGRAAKGWRRQEKENHRNTLFKNVIMMLNIYAAKKIKNIKDNHNEMDHRI